jgi:5-methylcytosine-specific restriction endonuclease McrA
MEDGLILNAHHIIPRPRGKTIMSNLVTLCESCHDFVEMNGFNFDFQNEHIKIEAKSKDWHRWVYGGYAKPK